MIPEEIRSVSSNNRIQLLVHAIHILGDGEFDVIFLPTECRMDIHVTFLMQEAVGGLDAVFSYRCFHHDFRRNFFC